MRVAENHGKKACTGETKETVVQNPVHKKLEYRMPLLGNFYLQRTESIIKLSGNIRFQTFASNSMIL